jgi:signal transduction histidine kinase
MVLSDVADQIAAGKKIKRIPRTWNDETNNLSKKLLNLQRVLSREARYKAQLSEALEINKASDSAKDDFIRQLRATLAVPLKVILNGAKSAREEKFGKLDIRTYRICFDAIYDAGKQLESFTTQFLEIGVVDIAEIVEKCVIISKKFALEHGIKLESKIPDSLPALTGDKVRINQILLSTIYNSLLCLPCHQNSRTEVLLSLEQRQDSHYNNWVCIIVRDNGGNVDEDDRQNIWLEYLAGKYSGSFNTIDGVVDLYTIDHLLDLHKGVFEVQYVKNKGMTFKIWLPYLSKSDFDPMSISQPKKKLSSFQNVVEFPR